MIARRRAWRWGHLAEALCALDLRLRGYRVIARRLRCPLGEIDIVARRGRILAIIEVKARRGGADAAAAIGARQRARISRAAEWLLATRPDLAALDMRFDAMLVSPWRRPRHLRDAWRDGVD
jgi:putative endonuclease